jgi:hypothetical protein
MIIDHNCGVHKLSNKNDSQLQVRNHDFEGFVGDELVARNYVNQPAISSI